MSMKNRILIYSILCLMLFSACSKTAVSISYDKESRQENYAAKMLSKALKENGYTFTESSGTYSINFAINANNHVEEAFSIETNGNTIDITGGDERGLIYGALSVAEDIRNGITIENIKAKNEEPKLQLRAVKYDLPWDTYRHSEALSQHDETCRDTTYWEAFLDMMAENRLNSLSLWNLHTYPFLIKAKNFPEASPFTDEEFKVWQTLFQTIIRMAKDRAIDTYIIPFNIFVTPEFSKAHNVLMDNLQHDFFVRGDTSEIIKRYTRESVTQMLEEYPDLSGIGLTLGEGMAGMTPQEREDWITETIIEGMRLANRKSKLVHRVPFSSTTSSLSETSIETERITRRTIEREADMGFSDGPIWADFKFNWSHAHSTPKLIKVHGGKLYDTYFNPVSDKYKVTWTARNEDFFCLRWGVPSFVREHILTNSQDYVGGYFIGSETYIPAKDYFTTDMKGVDWKYAFERQWLFYKIWGRLLYDPQTSDDVFHAEFIRRYGDNGKNLLEASSLAGKTPLRFASSIDCGWDFTLYSEGFMALNPRNRVSNPDGPLVEYVSVERLINQLPLDTSFVNVAQYVNSIIEGEPIDQSRITPVMVSEMLETDCSRALELVKDITTNKNNALKYEVSDIRIWSNIGLHFSEKIKGAIALQLYRKQGGEEHKQTAIKHLENALGYWDKVIEISRPIYNDMPLTHLSEQNGKYWTENDHLRFHWEIIRPDVAKDLETAKAAK